MAFTGQARTGQCHCCFSLFHTSNDSELGSDRGMNIEPQYLRSPYTVSCPQRLIYHHWNKEHTPKLFHPKLSLQEHFIPVYNQFWDYQCSSQNSSLSLSAHPKVEAGHLLQGSHNLHHYSPRATSLNHHFWACPDDVNMLHIHINIVMITYTNLPPHTPILNSICIRNYISC